MTQFFYYYFFCGGGGGGWEGELLLDTLSYGVNAQFWLESLSILFETQNIIIVICPFHYSVSYNKSDKTKDRNSQQTLLGFSRRVPIVQCSSL